MKLSSRLLIMLFTVVMHAGVAINASAVEKSAHPTILVYGDSLSAAYRMPQAQGWVSLLQQRLQAQGYPHKVVNASVSGETTSGGLSRLPITLRQHQPDVVLLELGANDGLRGLSVAQMRNNLDAMIKTSRQSGAEVVLVGIMIPPNYGSKYTQEFSRSFRDLANHYQLPLVKFMLEGVAGKPELTLDDGLHPSAAAQPKILDNIWQVLAPELKGSESTAVAR